MTIVWVSQQEDAIQTHGVLFDNNIFQFCHQIPNPAYYELPIAAAAIWYLVKKKHRLKAGLELNDNRSGCPAGGCHSNPRGPDCQSHFSTSSSHYNNYFQSS